MAINYTGELIHERRIRRSMTFGDLARACGAGTHKQTSRISQRLVLFEREGVRDRRLLEKVIAALDLDMRIVNELLNRQRDEELRAWHAWVSEPAPMELHVRPFSGFWFKKLLPDDIACDELRAIEHARAMTSSHEDMRVVLKVSRRVAYTFSRGQLIDRREAVAPHHSLTPFVTVGGRGIQFKTSE